MSASLVGSEMCIRDRYSARSVRSPSCSLPSVDSVRSISRCVAQGFSGGSCLLYTSDAADDM
eukprot:10118147-Alexandrium_andersonii.AAC.1